MNMRGFALILLVGASVPASSENPINDVPDANDVSLLQAKLEVEIHQDPEVESKGKDSFEKKEIVNEDEPMNVDDWEELSEEGKAYEAEHGKSKGKNKDTPKSLAQVDQQLENERSTWSPCYQRERGHSNRVYCGHGSNDDCIRDYCENTVGAPWTGRWQHCAGSWWGWRTVATRGLCGDECTQNSPRNGNFALRVRDCGYYAQRCSGLTTFYANTLYNGDDLDSSRNYITQWDMADGSCKETIVRFDDNWGPVGDGDFGCMGRCGRGCAIEAWINWGGAADCLKHDACAAYARQQGHGGGGGCNDANCGDEQAQTVINNGRWSPGVHFVGGGLSACQTHVGSNGIPSNVGGYGLLQDEVEAETHQDPEVEEKGKDSFEKKEIVNEDEPMDVDDWEELSEEGKAYEAERGKGKGKNKDTPK